MSPQTTPTFSTHLMTPRLCRITVGLLLISAMPVSIPLPAVADQPSIKTDDLPAKLTLELAPHIKLELVLIPPGTFVRGSPAGELDRRDNEGPTQTVTISQPFYMGVYEVTQAQYSALVEYNPSHFSPSGKGQRHLRPDHDPSVFPVESTTWVDADNYAKRLTEKLRQTSGLTSRLTVRLPTEAEWEYACRAGTTTATHYGDSLSQGQANFNAREPYNGGSRGDWLKMPRPVGSYSPNKFGLYDMHGNVWEWCLDVYADYPPATDKPLIDPVVLKSDEAPEVWQRVARGGSWSSDGSYCRSARRHHDNTTERVANIGFRIVAVVDQP